jgi:hypothetical protein
LDTVRHILDQPFSQPIAILLRELEDLRAGAPEALLDVRRTVISRVRDLRDPVLDLCAGRVRLKGARTTIDTDI